MTVIDGTKIDDPTNADEMLAWSLVYCEAGDVVVLHSDWCRTQLGCDTNPCTCRPIVLTVGAKA